MQRFENAQVGDKVYCRRYGEGVITHINLDSDYPLEVQFNVNDADYTFQGKILYGDVEPMLFYVDGDNKYTTERPAQKLLASMVPVDTKVITETEAKRYFAGGTKLSCFMQGATSWSEDAEDGIGKWTDLKLAEPLSINGVTYPVGTKIVEG